MTEDCQYKDSLPENLVVRRDCLKCGHRCYAAYEGEHRLAFWDFELGYDGWIYVDADGDGATWGYTSWDAFSGTYGLESWCSYTGNSPDDWAISPAFSLAESQSATLSLRAKGYFDGAGYEELLLRESTRVFADVALGHHAWYQGEGYPKDYVRNQSPYRQMTDVTAVVAYLIDHCHGEPEQTIQAVIRQEGKRFSPMVTAFLNNEALRRDLIDLLTRDDGPLFQEWYEAITA